MPRQARNPGSGKPPHNGPASGAGWGGPPKGEGKKGAGHGQGRPEGVKNGEGKKARAAAALEEALPDAVATVVAISRDITDQRALMAANNIIDRVLGKVGDKLTLAGDADAPLQTKVIVEIVRPPVAGEGGV